MLFHRIFQLFILFIAASATGNTLADWDDDYHRNNYPCPYNYYNQPYVMSNGTVVDDPMVLNRTIDEEFGEGAEAITHCLGNRKHAKVLIAINGAHPTNKNGIAQTDKARFLSNLEYMRENYEDMHNMKIGEDVKILAVASNSGALLMTTEHPAWLRDKTGDEPDCSMKPVPGKTCTNPFRGLVERGMEIGIKFYLCQMASRVLGIKMANKIPGVKFVPGGHIAVADFQMDGYALIDL